MCSFFSRVSSEDRAFRREVSSRARRGGRPARFSETRGPVPGEGALFCESSEACPGQTPGTQANFDHGSEFALLFAQGLVAHASISDPHSAGTPQIQELLDDACALFARALSGRVGI